MAIISALTCVLPKNYIENDYFKKYFDKDYIKKATRLIGVNDRYWAGDDTTLSMCVSAAENLFKEYASKNGNENIRSKIDLLVFITQTPKSLIPGIAYQAHDKLNLDKNCRCISINAGCTAYVDGITIIFDLLKSQKYKKALLLVGDTLSKYLDIKDFSTSVVFGDAGSATLIENKVKNTKSIFLNQTFPNSSDALGLKLGNELNDNLLKMNGTQVFNFAIGSLPKMISKSIDLWNEKYLEAPSIDHYLFHQANSMIIDHVKKKLKLDNSNVPINIDKYGNTSGVTVPLLLCSMSFEEKNKILLICGFGSGLASSIMITDAFQLEFAKVVYL